MHEEGCDHCRSNESYGYLLTELAVPACKSGEYNPPPSVPHMDGKRAAPHPGRRVDCCRGRRPDVPSARRCRAGRRIPTPVCTPRALASRRALARNDSASRCLGGRSRPPLRCEARGACMRDVEGGVSDGITRRPAGMRLRVAPIRLTTFRDAGMIAGVPSHS